MVDTINKSLRLKSGYEMPVLGLGTWKLTGRQCIKTVRKAIELGYRHIDTAEAYENEAEIGEAIKGFDRGELFITSKAVGEDLEKEKMFKACRQSLHKLGTDYLDLYLAHWPNENVPLAQTLEALATLVEEGMVRSIGLSNYDTGQMREAVSIANVPVSNAQVRYNPLSRPGDLLDFCRKEGITVTAYSPLAKGEILNEPTVTEIAQKYRKTGAQVSLRWLVQKGNIVIPKASSEKHLLQNMQILDWELSKEDLVRIDNIRAEIAV